MRPERIGSREKEGKMQGFARNFGQPDETTRFPNGHENIINVMGTAVGLLTLQPGWRWSNDVRPLMGSDRCPLVHAGYVLSGQLHVESADGSTFDIAPGDLYGIEPGHDAWVVGDVPCALLDWEGKVREYAKPVDQAIGGAR
jgi:hypothetical protein